MQKGKFFKGAEAVVRVMKNKVVKTRHRKRYRVYRLDSSLRAERTKREFKIMKKLYKKLPVPQPYTLRKYSFYMEYIKGEKPEFSQGLGRTMGKYLAIMHENDIIHGDFTPANIMFSGKKTYVIDFGLSFVSKRIEDKADDVFTTIRSLGEFSKDFLDSYSSNYSRAEEVIKRVEKIKNRARYT